MRVYAKPMSRIANKDGPCARLPLLSGGPACPQDIGADSFSQPEQP